MATYYVDQAGGSDSNDGLTPATAKASLGSADALANGFGDKVRLIGLYQTTASIALNNADHLEGCNAAGVVDGTMAEIRATGAITGSLVTSGPDILRFVHFNANNNCTGAAYDGAGEKRFGCWYSNAGTYGARGGSVFMKCRFFDNAEDGVSSVTATRIAYSLAFRNGRDGFVGHRCIFANNIAWGNGRHGLNVRYSSSATDCVALDNPSNGFEVDFNASVIRSIAAYNGLYGFERGTGYEGAYVEDCIGWQNTSGTINRVPEAYNVITADPLFVSPLTDPPDVGMPVTSPAVGAAVNSMAGSVTVNGAAYPPDICGFLLPASGGGSSGSPLGSPFIRV